MPLTLTVLGQDQLSRSRLRCTNELRNHKNLREKCQRPPPVICSRGGLWHFDYYFVIDSLEVLTFIIPKMKHSATIIDFFG